MNANIRRRLRRRKARIQARLDKIKLGNIAKPVFTASNIHFELADKARGFVHAGIGAIQLLVRKLGLDDAIDRRLHLLKTRFQQCVFASDIPVKR